MNLFRGINYNIRGLLIGLKTPGLLFWGLVRLILVIIITILSATLILSYHQEILNALWNKPESNWVLWLWHILSWLLSLILVGISVLVSYLISQILFSVLIMDHMSRITEIKTTGTIKEPDKISMPRLFIHLIRQEIPRAIIPVTISLLLMIGGLTPLGPLLAILSSCIAAVFLAWDNTDLVPARRLVSFKDRFSFLKKNLLFHLGFGLLFLIPVANILFLSFAPVGATIYHLEKKGIEED
jgi:CysZ protein